MNSVLSKLGISEFNFGACSGKEQWSKSKDGGLIESINPSNGELIASVYQSTESDYDKVIHASLEAFKEFRKVPAPIRGQLVREMGEALRDHKDALGTLVSMEMGKIKQEGDGEVQEMIDIADFAVGQSRMLYGKTMHSERPDHRMYEQWHPLGAIGVISAFNFPVAVWAWNAFIAAICGNTTIWKPSSSTPLTAIAVQHICNSVMERNGYSGIFSILIGRGSERFGKTILELGGNNAIIVDETADMELVIPAVVFGAVGTAGQRCTSTRRIIVHESIYDSFLKKLLHAYKQVIIGDPLDSKTLMGPLVNQQAVDDYLLALKEVKESGGELHTGGKIIEGNGYYVQPSIETAENNWDIVQKETFAPFSVKSRFEN